jgi:hypothetical protein
LSLLDYHQNNPPKTMKRSGSTASSGGSGMGLSTNRSKSLETMELRMIAEVEEKLLKELNDVLTEISPNPDEVQEHCVMLEYVANLCSSLHVDNDFSGQAWEPCVQP